MKTAIIVHGMPSRKEYFDAASLSQSHKHWLAWLQRQLIVRGMLTQAPEMPEPYEPDYEKWCSVFEQFHIDEDTHLIGHSCGGGFLVRYLSEHHVCVGKVALVAPWLNPNRVLTTSMFDFEIDPQLVEKTKGVTVFYSTDDNPDIVTSVEMLCAKLPLAQIKTFTDKGHFTYGAMKTDQFPELLQYLIS